MANSAQPDTIQAAAIAGSAVSLALFDALIAQGFLTKEAALEILATAQRRVSASTNNPDVRQAALIISGLHERLKSQV